MSAAGPPQGDRPPGGAARSAVRGEPASAAGPPQGDRPPGGAARSAVRGESNPVAEHPQVALIGRFYAALGRRDAATMIACYHADAQFSDPVFPRLDRAGVAAMWGMLCARGKDLAVDASAIAADDATGQAHWVATYTFAATGRRVVNRIDARFVFRDGLIVEHEDRFDLRRWMRQALGWKGLLLGWLPAARRGVQAQAARALDAWRAQRAPAPPGAL